VAVLVNGFGLRDPAVAAVAADVRIRPVGVILLMVLAALMVMLEPPTRKFE